MLRLFIPPCNQASPFARFRPARWSAPSAADRDLDLPRWFFAAAVAAATFVGSPALAADRPLVAVIDGGVARTAELEGVLVEELDFAADPARPPFTPTHDHGTLVATVLHRAAGGAVDIMSLRIDDPAGCPEGANAPCQRDPLPIATAIHAAIDLGADAINISLNMPDDPAIIAAVHRAAASGMKVVLAAGNDGADSPGNRKAAVAGYPGAVLVGALDWTGEAWAGSNQPDAEAGRSYKYVWRPGVAVDTIRADGTPGRASGTSIAAPIETAFIVTGTPARPAPELPLASDFEDEVEDAPPEVTVTSATTVSTTPREPSSVGPSHILRDLALGCALGLAFLVGRLRATIAA